MQIQHPDIFNGVPVDKITVHKHIGLILDSKLSFVAHVKATISKTRRNIGILKMLSKHLPRNALCQIYKSYADARLDDSEIKRVSRTKSIGVMVDENLNWDKQFKAVKNKIYGGLASLKKLKNILPQSKLGSVYYVIVESHFRYADVIWGSLQTRKLETLQRLQNRALSIIESAKLKDNWSCDWLNVNNLISFDRLVMTYQIMNKLGPESLRDKFELRSTHSR